MVEALGHNVPRVFMLVFGGGCALAGLAGVIGGNAFVTEPGMAAAVGSIVFVVVVFGGMGSLTGAFVASLFFGAVQTFSGALDYSLLDLAGMLGVDVGAEGWRRLLSITVAQTAPVLPYLLMVLMLIVRPRGLMGTRES
jgi:branched-chain amino acid transport system permease protein